MRPQMVHSDPEFICTFTDGRLLDSRGPVRALRSGGTLQRGRLQTSQRSPLSPGGPMGVIKRPKALVALRLPAGVGSQMRFKRTSGSYPIRWRGKLNLREPESPSGFVTY